MGGSHARYRQISSRLIDRQTNRQPDRLTNRQTDRNTDRKICRFGGRQAGGQPERYELIKRR